MVLSGYYGVFGRDPKMPLYKNGKHLVRTNLEKIARGEKVKPVAIGYLAEQQLDALNAARIEAELWPMEAEIVFVGSHFYNSRKKQRYTIDDMVLQVESVMSNESITHVAIDGSTTMQNHTEREDGYGNKVKDKAVLECTLRRPTPELFSVMPKGDTNKPGAENEKGCVAAASGTSTNSPG